uniref:EOG090X0CZM n=1 Tax=Evadne anonyx TaxID=141404 RepID=A0A9N6ZF79_9CRUS|nr:EOG090X0CZM [Evadne anonyx]
MALSKWCKITSIFNLAPATCWNGALKRELFDAVQHRQYSLYPPHYREPVFEKSKIDELFKTGEAQQNAFVPVKAAMNDNNASVFYDEITSKFINTLMKKGDKLTARNLMEEAFVKIKQIQFSKYHQAETEAEKQQIILNPITILHKAIENCAPILQLTSIKRGGSSYQVPIPTTDKRGRALAMKWLIIQSNEKDRKVHFPDKLATELIDAASNTGRVVKRKQDLHRQCEANRAYAHFRWG